MDIDSKFKADDQFSSRSFDEVDHPFRSKFERDRDRIMYSKAFRRLSGKTQVFLTGGDDHIRTRLTHTLEVAQIAMTISKALKLNLPLTEAIAYGHDIGHTPFGHVGERTLNYIMNGCYKIKNFKYHESEGNKGFKHNWQGLRVVTRLEQLNREFYGLNLTDYTLWGIVYHSNTKYKKCEKCISDNTCTLNHNMELCISEGQLLSLDFYERYANLIYEKSWSVEGLVVAMADEVAQRHHDVEDGIEANIIDKTDLIEKFEECFEKYLNEDEKQLIDLIKEEADNVFYTPMISKLIVNFLTTKLINDCKLNLHSISKEFNIDNSFDFNEKKKKEIIKKYELEEIINYDEDFLEKEKEFQKYLMNRILNSHIAQTMDGKASYIIRQLFKAYITNPQQLPDNVITDIYSEFLEQEEYDAIIESSRTTVTGELRNKLEVDYFTICNDEFKCLLMRSICDYIAGMTDKFAMNQYKLLYGIVE